LNISALVTLQISQDPKIPRYYNSKITLAGYDSDGLLKIGQVYMEGDFQKRGVQLSPTIETVTDILMLRLGGQEDVASDFYNHPDSSGQNAVLLDLANAQNENHGSSLTLEQLRDIATVFKERTAQKYDTVGGRTQIATVTGGAAQILTPQSGFIEVPHTLPNFRLLDTMEFDFGPVVPQQPTEPDSVALQRQVSKMSAMGVKGSMNAIIVNSAFANVKMDLSNRYYYNTQFTDCTLFYEGGPYYLDGTDKIKAIRFCISRPPSISMTRV
jgi:hypothetical protein